MMIELTPKQLQTLDEDGGRPRRAVDPRRNIAYVLLTEAEYEEIREILADEREQRAFRATAVRNAAGRLQEPP